MSDEISTLILTVDGADPNCYKKIKNTLNGLGIGNNYHDDENNKVIVYGTFDAETIKKTLQRRLNCIKYIEIKPVNPPPPALPPPPLPKHPECAFAYPVMPMVPVCYHRPCHCHQPHHHCFRCCSRGHANRNPEPAPNPMLHCGTPVGHCKGYKIVYREEPYHACSIM